MSPEPALTSAKIKERLGDLPLAAELYWMLRRENGPASGGYNFETVRQNLPGWRAEVEQAREKITPVGSPRRIGLFSIQAFWIRHQLLMGLALAGVGHQVSLAYLPHGKYFRAASNFDLRRQDIYLKDILGLARPFVEPVSLYRMHSKKALPDSLKARIADLSTRDSQYILQREDISPESEIYRLRYERNTTAALSAMAWLEKARPDLLIIPNGSIMEYEAVYYTAHYLGVDTVTYEFSELSQRIWLAINADVMRQDTNELWNKRRDQPLTEAQWDAIRTLFAARKKPQLWENFVFRYQGAVSEGAQHLRASLGLDQRPLVLLPTNVLGDSVTLGRQVFSQSMTDWILRSIQYFAQRPDLQFVIRIHPGELMLDGPSMAEIICRELPTLPSHIHLVRADEKVNTYDLIEAADFGLVYTTTAGLEMAMCGVPVVVAGSAHYRQRGFTLDPQSWEAYLALLDSLPVGLQDYRMTQEKVELAWNYAYRYFYEFPHPYPWHLYNMDKDLHEWPLSRVLSQDGLEKFGATLDHLAGKPVTW